MKIRVLIFISASLFFSCFASANTVSLNVKCEASEDGGDEGDGESQESDLKSEGWIFEEDEYGSRIYRYSAQVDTASLPLSKTIGSLAVSLSKSGLLEVGMSVGDADASSESSLQLPLDGKDLAVLSPLTLSSSGGDHASGTWSYGCDVQISVHK